MSVSDAGKGSVARPFSVDHETFANNWDLIFGKKEEEKEVVKQNKDKYNDK